MFIGGEVCSVSFFPPKRNGWFFMWNFFYDPISYLHLFFWEKVLLGSYHDKCSLFDDWLLATFSSYISILACNLVI